MQERQGEQLVIKIRLQVLTETTNNKHETVKPNVFKIKTIALLRFQSLFSFVADVQRWATSSPIPFVPHHPTVSPNFSMKNIFDMPLGPCLGICYRHAALGLICQNVNFGQIIFRIGFWMRNHNLNWICEYRQPRQFNLLTDTVTNMLCWDASVNSPLNKLLTYHCSLHWVNLGGFWTSC